MILDFLGEKPTGKIHLEIKSSRSSFYESQARAYLSQNARSAWDLDSFINGFWHDMKNTTRRSILEIQDCFKLDKVEKNKLELWHLNVNSERDRLIAVVTWVPVEQEGTAI